MALEVADVEHLLWVFEIVLALVLELLVESTRASEVWSDGRGAGMSLTRSSVLSFRRMDLPGIPQLTLMPAPVRTRMRWLFLINSTASTQVLYCGSFFRFRSLPV